MRYETFKCLTSRDCRRNCCDSRFFIESFSQCAKVPAIEILDKAKKKRKKMSRKPDDAGGSEKSAERCLEDFFEAIYPVYKTNF